MSNKITDEFTGLKLSRQRKYQLRKKQSGLCEWCRKKVFKWGLCKAHALNKYHTRRKLHGCTNAYDCLTAELVKKVGKK